MLEEINETRKYLYYLEEHYNNVRLAWNIVKEKCKYMRFIYDDFCYYTLNHEIEYHDESKMSKEEFVPYRMKFYPTEEEKKEHSEEIDKEFKLAWEHHKHMNDHHWQKWTVDPPVPYPEIAVAHNVIDWMAMSFKFNDTALSYYEKNKCNIFLPEWAEKFMYEIFDRVYKK